jgi:hypothetical protein
MVQQTVHINGRAVMVLERGALYRVESKARQAARAGGRSPSRVRPHGTASYHTVEATCTREAIAFADDPNMPKIDEIGEIKHDD